MRAIVCRDTSGVANLKIEDIAEPPMQPGALRVRIRIAALNPPHALMAQGKYQVKPEPPFVLGVEGMGTIIETSADAGSFRQGQRVMVYASHGCLAEELVVSRDRAHPVPDGMSAEVAAGILLAYGTSYHGRVTRGRLAPGETVVVLGAAGGLGTSAIQIAKAVGARVIAVASSDAKLDYCLRNGADHGIASGSGTIREQLRELTQGRGADVIYDVVGGELTELFLRGIAPYGRLLIAGYASGVIPAIKANLILLKQADVIGVSFRQYFEQKPELAHVDLDHLCALWSTGKLRATMPKIVDLEQASHSLSDLASGKVPGKTTVRVA